MNLEITLTKTRTYDLKPFGKFKVVWNAPKKDKENVLPVGELHYNGRESFPLVGHNNDAEDKKIVKYMVFHKTDVLTDGENFYTRTGSGFTKITHHKISSYMKFVESRKHIIDEYTYGDLWNEYING